MTISDSARRAAIDTVVADIDRLAACVSAQIDELGGEAAAEAAQMRNVLGVYRGRLMARRPADAAPEPEE